ncbi:MAG: sulfatase-like hydrolase/transferase [Muribaculaceae bacterium]|nr:sulfatase-like hydrolase/transferase [Muribaculaceae bacterium]
MKITLSKAKKVISEMLKSHALIVPTLIFVLAYLVCYLQFSMFMDMTRPINAWIDVRHLTLVADVWFILMFYFLLGPCWRWTVLLPVWLVTAFCYVNLWYVRAFYDLMPLDMMLMAQNLSDRVVDGALEQLSAEDLALLALPVAFTVLVILLRRPLRQGRFETDIKVGALVLWIPLFYFGFRDRADYVNRFYHVNAPLSKMMDVYYTFTYNKSYKMSQHLERLGFISYLFYQAEDIWFSRSLTRDEREKVNSFWEARRQCMKAGRPVVDSCADFVRNRSRNLIFIIVESLSSEAAAMTVNGAPVAPVLSSLMADSSSLVFTSVIPQTNHGRSSDGQFIYNTGLLPLRNAVLAKRYPQATYPGLARALKGYESSEVCGEPPTFYNHNHTNQSYGYDNFLPSDIGYWLKDEVIFNRALLEAIRLNSTGKPFFMSVITLSMHDPYDSAPAVTDISAARSVFPDERSRNYLEQLRLTDAALGSFLNELKKRGIYDDSVIVIASDHEPRARCLPQGWISDRVLFMVLNSGMCKAEHSDRFIGQVDVFPTVLQIMGVDDYEFPGVGRSVLADTMLNYAKDAFGRVYGTPDATQADAMENMWQISELMVAGGYFR